MQQTLAFSIQGQMAQAALACTCQKRNIFFHNDRIQKTLVYRTINAQRCHNPTVYGMINVQRFHNPTNSAK